MTRADSALPGKEFGASPAASLPPIPPINAADTKASNTSSNHDLRAVTAVANRSHMRITTRWQNHCRGARCHPGHVGMITAR
ncbi:hypothetical protein GCM10009764_69760 [Nocardia ninae]